MHNLVLVLVLVFDNSLFKAKTQNCQSMQPGIKATVFVLCPATMLQ